MRDRFFITPFSDCGQILKIFQQLLVLINWNQNGRFSAGIVS